MVHVCTDVLYFSQYVLLDEHTVWAICKWANECGPKYALLWFMPMGLIPCREQWVGIALLCIMCSLYSV